MQIHKKKEKNYTLSKHTPTQTMSKRNATTATLLLKKKKKKKKPMNIRWDSNCTVSHIVEDPKQQKKRLVTSPLQCLLSESNGQESKQKEEFQNFYEHQWENKTLKEIRESAEYKLIPPGYDKGTLKKSALCELLSSFLSVAATTPKPNKKKRKRADDEEEEGMSTPQKNKFMKKAKIQLRVVTPKTKNRPANENDEETMQVLNVGSNKNYTFQRTSLMNTLKSNESFAYMYLGGGKVDKNAAFLLFPKHRVFVDADKTRNVLSKHRKTFSFRLTPTGMFTSVSMGGRSGEIDIHSFST